MPSFYLQRVYYCCIYKALKNATVKEQKLGVLFGFASSFFWGSSYALYKFPISWWGPLGFSFIIETTAMLIWIGISSARRIEISQNLAAVEREITLAVEKSNRDRSEITLIAVTKNFPVSDVVHLYDLGLRNFGENRDQEARAKVEEFKKYVADSESSEDQANLANQVKWHFQGQLQRNKLRSIATWADFIHSLDQRKIFASTSTIIY